MDSEEIRKIVAEDAFIDEEWLKGLKPFRLTLSGLDGETETPARPRRARRKGRAAARHLHPALQFARQARQNLEEFRRSVGGEYKIIGVLGVGSDNVVFKALDPQGQGFALRMLRRNWSFDSYIRELRPGMSFDGEEPDRLYRKLDRLIGDPMLDKIVTEYDDLYWMIVENLRSWPPFKQIKWDEEEATKVMSFVVRAPGTTLRLQQLALAKYRPEIATWAKKTLRHLRSVKIDPLFQPEALHMNPLYAWGGAMLSGFFADPVEAARLVHCRLRARPQELKTFVAQGWALAQALIVFGISGHQMFANFWETACADVKDSWFNQQ